MTAFIIYADDSGDAESSFFSAVLMPVDQWTRNLARWLSYRAALYRQHQVLASFELHAVNWVTGKDQPAADRSALINTSVGLRREWSKKALQCLQGMGGVGVLTCRVETAVKADAYRVFVEQLDRALFEEDAWGMLIVDGNPTDPDPGVKRAHRELPVKSRRIVEDGWVQDSSSQLIQLADLVVHCAFQAHKRNPAREYMWDWYREHVHHLEWRCECPILGTTAPSAT